MGLFVRGLGKPGKGIDPDAPQKRGFFRFFDIFFRKFWHFVRLNLLYAVISIPAFFIIFFLAGYISNGFLGTENAQNLLHTLAEQSGGDPAEWVARMQFLFDVVVRFSVAYLFMNIWGLGPSTAGITYVLRNFAREEHAWIWIDFRDALKANFKQSILVFIIDLLAFVLFFFAIRFYILMGGVVGLLRYVVYVVAILYTFMHLYIYPLMVTFKLSLKNIYRNALLFAVGRLPGNLLITVLLFGINAGVIYGTRFLGGSVANGFLFIGLALIVFVMFSFSAFITNFYVYPQMKRYMLTEQNIETKPDTPEE